MRDCRDVIMLAKPGYIYVVRNGGKNGSGKTGGGKKVAGRKRREESGGKKVAARKRREEIGGKTGKKWREEEESRAGHLIFSPGWWVQLGLKVVLYHLIKLSVG